MARSLPVLAAVAALSLVLTACSDQSSATGGAPAGSAESQAASSTAAPANLPDGWQWAAGPDAPSQDAEPSVPTTVTDGTGAEVEIDDPSKIIVGGDDVADILGRLGLGDLIYAAPTNSASEYALAAPEQFEFGKSTGVEGLLSIDGTLFIGNNPSRHGDVAEQFRSADVDAVVIDDQQSTGDKIRAVASYLGVDNEGETLATTVEEQFAEAAEVAGDQDDLRILQVTADGAGGADAVVGTGTAGADIVEAIGATSVGVEAGMRGYSVEYGDEGLLDAAPDVILMGTADLEQWGGLEGFIAAFPTLMETPAGEAGNIIVMPSTQVKVSGPASGAGALGLARAVAELG